MKSIDKIIEETYNRNPYKIEGKPETYNKYNEGWSDACDILGDRIKKQLIKEVNETKKELIELREYKKNMEEIINDLEQLGMFILGF